MSQQDAETFLEALEEEGISVEEVGVRETGMLETAEENRCPCCGGPMRSIDE